MGMPISIHVRAADVCSPAVAHAVQEAFAVLREADRLFSTYQQDSEVSRIRRGELDPALADPAVRQVIELCHRARVLTEAGPMEVLRGVLSGNGKTSAPAATAARASRTTASTRPRRCCSSPRCRWC